MFTIHSERAADAGAIDALHDHAFGPGRFARTGFLLRGAAPHDMALSATAWQDGRLVGSIRFNPILVGHDDGTSEMALLLGPLAVIRERQGNGLGLSLVRHGLTLARSQGHDLVLLIGEPAYYAKAGFAKVRPGALRADLPLDQNRLCWLRLSGAADAPAGSLRTAGF